MAMTPHQRTLATFFTISAAVGTAAWFTVGGVLRFHRTDVLTAVAFSKVAVYTVGRISRVGYYIKIFKRPLTAVFAK